jgi:two-component system CheB/CheR fusion protein
MGHPAPAALTAPPHGGRTWPTVALVLATAVVYFAAAKLGLTMAFLAEQVTPVWPPTGIALAAVLLFGSRVWPGIALGALTANLTASEPVLTACGIAAGNTLEALIAAGLLRRTGFRPALGRLRDVRALVVYGAAVSTTVSATIGVTSLCAGGLHAWSAFPPLWSVWWLGDAMGDLVMAPVLLVWTHARRARPRPARLAEAAVLAGGAIVVTVLVFVGTFSADLAAYPVQYLIFPFVIWAAVRFRQPGATATAFLVSAIAIWSTVNGYGPFRMGSLNESLVMLQLFLAVVAVTGLLLGAVITERDVAQHRHALDYAQLGQSEQRLRLALDAARLGVWDWNILTGEVKWTDNLEPIHGLAPGTFQGTMDGFQALIHAEDRARVDAAIRSAIEGRGGYEIEFRIRWPDGSVHWIAATGRVLHDDGGRAGRMLGTGMDITERKRLEEELRQRARELADADQRKDEFLAMLAHELRNPLAPLRNALHLLRLDVPGRERFVEIADRQLTHLVRLVDDLLDVSRITQGKITLRREHVLLADVAARAVEMMRAVIDARGHNLTVSLPGEPVRLVADPARLAQVIGNLLGNAVKYTPPGGSIWLTAERAGGEVVIRVRDTGVGLAPELIPHVFDLFVQGDASLDRTRGGLGIGLTLVRRLVELHGGRVAARSAGLGQGSEFVVHLPALPAQLAPTVAPEAVGPATPGGRRLKVLIVEDNQDAAESLALVLDLWGHDARVVFDGAAALDVAEQYLPDVIISDLGLPGMDGYQLARQLREHPTFGRAVLIALSGYGQEEDKRRALDAGFDHHFVKPPNLAELSELLGRVVVREAEGRSRTLH